MRSVPTSHSTFLPARFDPAAGFLRLILVTIAHIGSGENAGHHTGPLLPPGFTDDGDTLQVLSVLQLELDFVPRTLSVPSLMMPLKMIVLDAHVDHNHLEGPYQDIGTAQYIKHGFL